MCRLIQTMIPLAASLAIATLSAASAPPTPRLDDLLKGAEDKVLRGDFAGANAAFEESLRIARESHDPRAEATARRGLARSMGLFPESLAQAQAALALDRSLGNAAGEAADLVTLGQNYRFAGSSSKALEALTGALAIERRLHLHSEEAQTLAEVATVQYVLGSYEEALFSFEEALTAARRDGTALTSEVQLTTELGDLNADLGRYEDAERYLKMAIASARRLREQTASPAWGQVHARLGRLSEDTHAKLTDLFHQVGEANQGGQPREPLGQEMSDPEVRRVALERTAEMLEEMGQKMGAKADALGYTAVKPVANVLADPEFQSVWQHLLADLRPGVQRWGGVANQLLASAAAAFNRAALGHFHLQDLPDGWPLEQARQLTDILHAAGNQAVITEAQISSADSQSFHSAKAWHGRDGSPNWDERDLQQMNRGMANKFGDQARSLRRAIAAGTMDDQTVAKVAPYALVLLNGFKVGSQLQGDLSPGVPFDKFGNGLLSFNCELNALTTLGRIYLALDDRENARARNDEAWDLLAKMPIYMPAPSHRSAKKLGLPIPYPSRCGAFSSEVPNFWEAEFAAAENHKEDAIHDYESIAKELHGPNPEVWERIALLYAEVGAKDHARDYYRKAIDASEAIQGQIRLSELVASWASNQEPVYAQAIRLLYDLAQPVEAFEYAERARARAFLNQLGNRLLPAANVPPELAATLQQARQRLIELENLPNTNEKTSPAHRTRGADTNLLGKEEEARKLYQEIFAKVVRTNPEYASVVSIDTASLAQVQGEILDDSTSLIEYFVLADKTLAWVIDRQHVEWVSLPISAPVLRERISYLRNLIAARRPSDEAAAALHATVFAPLEPYLRHRNVIVVPHGPLHFLPFGALWSAARGRFVAQDYVLTLAPSASVLRFVRGKLKQPSTELLALGNPDGTLPHAEREVQLIAALFDSTPLVQKDATKSRLYRDGESAGIVHLAAHTTLEPLRPLFSHIDLAADRGLPPQDERADGRLHVHEIYGLNLKNANLVVLSSCETALGRRDEGDDLVGLTRAFLYAGAPAVLSTLWSVDDDATAVFMEGFYRRLHAGMTAAESLHAAQGDLLGRSQWHEPYFWAGFALTGAWSDGGHPLEAGPKAN